MSPWFSHYIIVSSEDNKLLVKGGIGTYLGLLCNAFGVYFSNVKMIWLTESPNGTFFVHKKKNSRIFYFPKENFKNKIQRNCLRIHRIFSSNKNNKIAIEAPDWEGLLSDVFTLNLGTQTLKITRLHSILELTKQNTPFFSNQEMEQIKCEHQQINHSDLISAPTKFVYQFTRKLLGKNFSSIPYCIVPNFINITFQKVQNISRYGACKTFNVLAKKEVISPDFINIFCVGSIEYRKGIDLSLKIAEHIIRDNKNIHFYFIGHYELDDNLLTLNKKYTKQYLESIIPYEINNNIHICGYIEYQKLRKIYNACDTFLFCYRHDNFPGALIEAALTGKNIVYLQKGGCSEIMKCGTIDLGIGFSGKTDNDIIRNGYASLLISLNHIGEKSAALPIKNKYNSKKIIRSICEYYTIK